MARCLRLLVLAAAVLPMAGCMIAPMPLGQEVAGPVYQGDGVQMLFDGSVPYAAYGGDRFAMEFAPGYGWGWRDHYRAWHPAPAGWGAQAGRGYQHAVQQPFRMGVPLQYQRAPEQYRQGSWPGAGVPLQEFRPSGQVRAQAQAAQAPRASAPAQAPAGRPAQGHDRNQRN